MPPKRAGTEISSADWKRSRVRNARTILTQQADLSVSEGKVDMPSFLHAREQEIRNMDMAINKSRAVGKQRQFQKLPRELRRRTASHNINRVPGNRRARAAKEMANDNTPLVPPKKKLRNYLRVKERALHQSLAKSKENLQKELSAESTQGESKPFDLNQHIAPTARFNKANKNALAPPPLGKAKYQHRQRKKTWLPTHVWHAKRAHLAEKWGFSIVTEPSLKSYRATHRSSTRTGAVAWDTSYYATFVLSGSQQMLENVLHKLTNNEFSRHQVLDTKYFNYEQVITGNISWEGMSYENNGAMLAPLVVVWKKDSLAQDRRILVRCHPAGSIRLVNAFINLQKNGTDKFDFFDYRFLLGSIEIVGPESTEALTSVLKIKPEQNASPTQQPLADLGKHWNRLGNVSNIAALPRNVVLALNCADPRLSYPPEYMRDACEYDFSDMVVNWPYDTLVNTEIMAKYGTVFDENEINKSYVNQPTQKSIDKRRARETNVGVNHNKLPYKETDPTFPVLILKRQTNSWTVILPWGWVLPVWYSLQHHSNVRVGGLDQRHQLDFEFSRLYFPDDFPGTVPGDIAASEEAADAQKKWLGKPASKRLAYDRIHVHGHGNPRGEIGSPFRCDWKYLWMLHAKSFKEQELVEFEKVKKLGGFEDPQDKETCGSNKNTAKSNEKYVKKIKIDELTKDSAQEPETVDEIQNTIENDEDTEMDNDTAEGSISESSSLVTVPSTEQSKTFISKLMNEQDSLVPHRYVTFSSGDVSMNSNGSQPDSILKPLVLKPISLKCVSKGAPEKGARIYKIPPANYKEWMKLAHGNHSNSVLGGTPYPSNNGLSMNANKTVVHSIHNDSENANYPSCPAEKYLIGYLTTGSFNLKNAKGTGVGAVLATAVEHPLKVIGNKSSKSQYCIVRNIGSTVARLATFEEIPLV